MKIPTVKLMVSRGFNKLLALSIRELMEQCESGDDGLIQTLDKISVLMEGFGTEHIQRGHNSKSPAIYYVNMGDTYDTTVLYYNGNFHIGCWGDIVERGNYD